MLWIWICVPIMVVGLGIAIVPVIASARREERRTLNQAYVTGEIVPPADDEIRIAAVAKPGISEVWIDQAFAAAQGSPVGAALIAANVHRMAGESEVLVTIPKDFALGTTRGVLEEQVQMYLRETGLFEHVRLLDSSHRRAPVRRSDAAIAP